MPWSEAQPDGYTLLVGGDSAITIMPNVQTICL